MTYYNISENTFEINGVFFENGMYRRLPQDLAEKVNSGVAYHNASTAGGRVRFRTNSENISVKVKYSNVDKMAHFALTGSVGLDLYADNVYSGTYFPDCNITDTLAGNITLDGKNHEILINMPTYSGIVSMEIGLDDNALLLPPKKYNNIMPIVYYGSSITQGGCCSRPGNTYEAIISREMNIDYINLGFSGSAKGEESIMKYIAGLEMSAFVLDYDHNAPDVAHLKDTHYKAYKIVRDKNEKLPIIMLTRPKPHLNDEEKERVAVVKESYERAKKEGDKNVYFIPGSELIDEKVIETATVDNTHPNDSGFVSMASRIEKELKLIISK